MIYVKLDSRRRCVFCMDLMVIWCAFYVENMRIRVMPVFGFRISLIFYMALSIECELMLPTAYLFSVP